MSDVYGCVGAARTTASLLLMFLAGAMFPVSVWALHWGLRRQTAHNQPPGEVKR